MEERNIGEWAGESLAELGIDPEDDAAYEAWCMAADCPDHGEVTIVDSDEMPSMAGGTDSSMTWSCGCVVMSTPYSHSRRRPDGTYGEVDR